MYNTRSPTTGAWHEVADTCICGASGKHAQPASPCGTCTQGLHSHREDAYRRDRWRRRTGGIARDDTSAGHRQGSIASRICLRWYKAGARATCAQLLKLPSGYAGARTATPAAAGAFRGFHVNAATAAAAGLEAPAVLLRKGLLEVASLYKVRPAASHQRFCF